MLPYTRPGADVAAETGECRMDISAGSTALQIAHKRLDGISFSQSSFRDVIEVHKITTAVDFRPVNPICALGPNLPCHTHLLLPWFLWTSANTPLGYVWRIHGLSFKHTS